jgi:hypothetical protein
VEAVGSCAGIAMDDVAIRASRRVRVASCFILNSLFSRSYGSVEWLTHAEACATRCGEFIPGAGVWEGMRRVGN